MTIEFDGVNNIIKPSNDAMQIGVSGDTITIPSGATITNSGTANGFGSDPDGAQTFNDSGAAVDFRIEGDTKQNLFFVDGSADRIGINTDSPDMLLDVTGTVTAGAGTDEELQQWNIGSDNVKAEIKYLDASATRGYSFGTSTQHDITFKTNDTTRIRIGYDGNASIGGTSSAGLFNLYTISHVLNAMVHTNSSDTGTIHNLRCINASGTLVGGITNDGSNTTFATSSDYRLKENVDYTWDATTRLKQLKPARFNWVADDTNTLMDGFIAHEVSSIVPEAVRGEKDATRTEIDENGDEQTFIEPQGIDQSKLVPLLVKTVQELEARIAELENA